MTGQNGKSLQTDNIVLSEDAVTRLGRLGVKPKSSRDISILSSIGLSRRTLDKKLVLLPTCFTYKRSQIHFLLRVKSRWIKSRPIIT